MSARRFEDLIVWQLANKLKQEILELIAKPPVSRDGEFCYQIRKSARSAPANISEGFGRYYPREFARFLRIAMGSLHETKNHLGEALDNNYLDAQHHERLLRLCLRAIKADGRLIAYLLKANAPEPFEPREPSAPREPFEPT